MTTSDQGKTNDTKCPTWTNDIKGMFTERDIECMGKNVPRSKRIDLTDYEDVKDSAPQIFSRVSTGSMPPRDSGEPRWTPEMVKTFKDWIECGMPE